MIRIIRNVTIIILLLAQVSYSQTDTTQTDISTKKAELNEKNVEVLELQSDLSIHDNELQYIRDEIEKLKQYNKRLEDSLLAKQTQIDSLKNQQNQVENFKLIVNTFKDDKTLTSEILESIQTSDVASEDTVTQPIDFDDSDFRTRYNEALNLYFDRNYQVSIGKFTELLNISNQHQLSDNCQYWLGECYYSLEKYPEAISEFKKVSSIGDGNKADAALFKTGMSYLKMGKNTLAVSSFKQLENQFPKSDLLGKAQQYLTTQEKF